MKTKCSNCTEENDSTSKYCNSCGFELPLDKGTLNKNANITSEDSKRNKITKFHFTLQDIPDSSFVLELSVWTGRSKLFMNNQQLQQSKEKGKPFLIPKANNEFIKAFPKYTFPDVVPTLEINGIKNNVAEKLKWFHYVLGGVPILLLFAGGIVGGVIGVIATMMNYNIFRKEGNLITKYLKVIAVIISALLIDFLIITLFQKFIF